MKMVTKIIDSHPDEVTDDHLMTIMPGLITITEHVSPMRKSAIFSMVTLHTAVGEDQLIPYINNLSQWRR